MSKKKMSDGKKLLVMRIHGGRCFGCRFLFHKEDEEGHVLVPCFCDAPVWYSTFNVVICQVCVGLLRGSKFNTAVEAAEFIWMERRRVCRTPCCRGEDFRHVARLIDSPAKGLPKDEGEREYAKMPLGVAPLPPPSISMPQAPNDEMVFGEKLPTLEDYIKECEVAKTEAGTSVPSSLAEQPSAEQPKPVTWLTPGALAARAEAAAELAAKQKGKPTSSDSEDVKEEMMDPALLDHKGVSPLSVPEPKF